MKVSKQLLTALEHFASGVYDQHRLIQERNGGQEAWSVEMTCQLALNILSEEGLAVLKLKILEHKIGKETIDHLCRFK